MLRLTATSTEERESCARPGEGALNSAVCAQEPRPHADDPPPSPWHTPRFRLLTRPQVKGPPPGPALSVEHKPLVPPHAPRTRPWPPTSRTEGPPPSPAPPAEDRFPLPRPHAPRARPVSAPVHRLSAPPTEGLPLASPHALRTRPGYAPARGGPASRSRPLSGAVAARARAGRFFRGRGSWQSRSSCRLCLPQPSGFPGAVRGRAPEKGLRCRG